MAYLPGSRNPDVVTVLWIWLPLTMEQESGMGMLPSKDDEDGYFRTKAAKSMRLRDLLPLCTKRRIEASHIMTVSR